jgi:hypothetical protein
MPCLLLAASGLTPLLRPDEESCRHPPISTFGSSRPEADVPVNVAGMAVPVVAEGSFHCVESSTVTMAGTLATHAGSKVADLISARPVQDF